jgi:two-component system nitrogen regulation response regulator NtrX
MKRILVIDDEPAVRETVGRMLERLGYEVALAGDGQEGLRVQTAGPADLVIADLYMPEMDGLELMVEFRRRFPSVPVIAMSGRGSGAAVFLVAEKLGAVGMLEKPLELAVLKDKVASALRRAGGAEEGLPANGTEG